MGTPRGDRPARGARGLVSKSRRGQPPRPQPRGATTPPAQSLPADAATSQQAVASPAAPQADNPSSARPPAPGLLDRMLSALPLSALVVVAVFSLRRLDDFDTWWHLASGRWIVQHLSIPQTDVLSFTVPQNEWINLQWLYDVLLYAVWMVGGPSGLVVASTICFVATFALLARHLGRFVGTLTTTLLLLWVATTVNERFLIRPEMASFPLLAAVQLVLAEGRDHPRRLRWLVPLMLVWANMHSLFIVGVAAIGCAIAGALVAELPILPANWRRDSAWPAAARRDLMKWGGAALAATLVNPYFVRALLFPLELMTRIDGSNSVYSSIGEFRPPFSGYFPTFAIGSYQAFVFAFLGLAAAAALVRAFARRPARGPAADTAQGFDVGVLAFAAALAWLSLMARRNIGIFAIGAVPFVAACAGILLARLPRSVAQPTGAIVRGASALVLAASLAICGTVVTNQWYAATGETHEFGLGVFESNFQSRAVEFFREQKLPGPAFNDMTAGGYLTWDEPTGKGVYVDGRLEVYDTPFFSAYMASLSNIQAWKKDADARGIQSVIVFHRWGNRHGFIRALSQLPEWRLVYYDETAAIFVRVTENPEAVTAAREAFTKTWRARTEDKLGGPRDGFAWQWGVDRFTAQLAYARVLETLGEPAAALAWFEKAIATGLPPVEDVETRQRVAQYLASSGQLEGARVHLEKAAEVDPANPTTQAMLGKLNELSR